MQYYFAVSLDIDCQKVKLYDKFNKEIGGARIKAIKNFDQTDELLNEKRFYYNDSSSVSSGILMNPLAFVNYGNDVVTNYGAIYSNCENSISYTTTIKYLYNHSQSTIQASNSAQGYHIGYSIVKEEMIGGQEGNGFVLKRFNNYPNFYSNSLDTGYNVHNFDDSEGAAIFNSNNNKNYFHNAPPNISYPERNGDLLLAQFFDKDSVKLRTVEYTYKYPTQEDIPSFYPENMVASGGKVGLFSKILMDCYRVGHINYYLNQYYIYSIKEEATPIKKIQQTDFLNGKEYVQEITYDYNDFYLPRSIQKLTSTGTTKIQNYYPGDIEVSSENFIDDLESKNIIGASVQSNKFVDESLVEISKKKFSLFNNTSIPLLKSLSVKKIGPNSIGTEENIFQYYHYDSHGNPQEFSRDSGPKIIYLWGYNKQYLIGKIENATYEAVVTALNAPDGNLDNIDESYFTSIENLRTILPDAQVTSYKYRPLIGLVSMTSPRGETKTFRYDNMNRLRFIIDYKNMIQKEFIYHYKN